MCGLNANCFNDHFRTGILLHKYNRTHEGQVILNSDLITLHTYSCTHSMLFHDSVPYIAIFGLIMF